MEKLDNLDKKIMYELDLNARISASQLGKKLRKSKETVNFRINKLIKNNYIKGFYSVFNTSKLGWFYYKIYMKFQNITPEKEKELFEYLQSQKNISFLAAIEGYYDAICLVMIKDSLTMEKFLNKFMPKYGEFIQEKEMCIFLSAHRLNQRFLYPGNISKDWSYLIKLGDYKLDEIESKILNILSHSARMPLTEIAEKLNIDAKTVNYRIKKLVRDNIIFSYVTAPNFEKLGLEFIQINLSLKDPSLKKQIIDFFKQTNKCLFALEMLGKYDMTIELHVENRNKLKEITNTFKEKFVGKYSAFDVSTITQEFKMVWSPFD